MREDSEIQDAAAAPHRRRRWKIALVVLVPVIVAVVTARALLPGYLRDSVNRTLGEGPDYRGRVGQIDVHLWRGAYTIIDLKITKAGHAVPVPFIECARIDLALDWRALLHGQARGRLVLEKPKVNFVAGPTPQETQTGADQPWLAMINDLFPFRIDRADVHDGEVHFHSFHTTPRVNVFLSSIEGSVRNLTNVADSTEPLVATVHAKGRAMDSGRFRFDMSLDPQAHFPAMEVAMRLLDVDVTALDDLTRAYGSFDFEQGRFDLVVEFSARHGFLDGYAKPLFRDVRVLGRNDLEEGGPLGVLWETAVGAVGEVFTNRPRDQIGTRFTFQGDIENPRTSILEVVGNVLRNAFIEAYLPRTEGKTAPNVVAASAEESTDIEGRTP